MRKNIRTYSLKDFDISVKEVKDKRFSIGQAANKYSIPRTTKIRSNKKEDCVRPTAWKKISVQ